MKSSAFPVVQERALCVMWSSSCSTIFYTCTSWLGRPGCLLLLLLPVLEVAADIQMLQAA